MGTARLAAAAAVVVGALVPAASATADPIVGPYNAAAGVFSGSVNVSPGIPTVGKPCVAQTLSGLNATAVKAVAFNTVITGYTGSLQLTGSGASSCDSLALGQGSLSLAIPYTVGDTGSTIECPTLTGNYTRVGSILQVTINGACKVNNHDGGVITFLAVGLFRPSQGDGINTPVTQSTFAGVFGAAPLLS
jgi:hypothetical protein